MVHLHVLVDAGTGLVPGRARFTRVLDRFVPPDGRVSPEELRRARTAIGIAMAIAPVMAALAATQLAWGNPQGGLGSLAIGVVLAIVPFLYRRWGRLDSIVHGVLFFAWAALSYIAISSRGAGINAASVGLAELPLFAVLLTGVRGGAAWVAVSCASQVGLAALGLSGRLVERIAPGQRLVVEYSALLLITLTLFAVGVLYEIRRLQALAEVSSQHRAVRDAEGRRMQAETDARLTHAEKLASIGRITAAVAHEINNPLSYLAMNLRFIREELDQAGTMPEVIEQALVDSIDGVSRIAHLVRRLRAYARVDSDAPENGATDLAAALRRAVELAEPTARGRAAVRCELAALPHARGQEQALVQVFLNLLVNAVQALPEERAAGNEISIHTRRQGDWLVVEVRDNGAGIAPDVLLRLGEPFFTTKPIGEGTGLGLAVSRSTLRAIGGKLEFESEPGRTIARVLLPVADPKEAEAEPEAQPQARGRIAPTVSSLRILIVDDDERVARSLQRALTAHEITAVSSGAAALDLLRREADFDLILCDLMMPGMTGMELYQVLAESHPQLLDRIIFSTGGAFTAGAREFCDRHAARVLGKPVSVEALTRVLVEAARQRPSGGAAAGDGSAAGHTP